MNENLARNTVFVALAVIVGLYFGYSAAYHDIILSCENNKLFSSNMESYDCNKRTKP